MHRKALYVFLLLIAVLSSCEEIATGEENPEKVHKYSLLIERVNDWNNLLENKELSESVKLQEIQSFIGEHPDKMKFAIHMHACWSNVEQIKSIRTTHYIDVPNSGDLIAHVVIRDLIHYYNGEVHYTTNRTIWTFDDDQWYRSAIPSTKTSRQLF